MNENVQTCRICLAESDRNVSIFDKKDSSTYSDLIKEYIGLKVEQDHNLPKGICDECFSELNVSIKFVSKFRSSDSKLQEALDLNVPFYKLFTNYIKEEDDDNLPLSIISSCIKHEKNPIAEEKNTIKQEKNTPKKEKNSIKKEKSSKGEKKRIKEEKNAIKKEISDVEFSDGFYYINEECNTEDEKGLKYAILRSEEHGLKKNMLQCLTCGLLVQSRSAFFIHYRRHTGEKPCKCPHCEKSFTQMGTLTDHIKRHHLKDKRFIEASDLTERIRKKLMKDKYGLEKRYTCDICGKQFLKKNYLTVHMRVHTLEKPYQCSYCPKGFRRCIDYIQHKRIHTGERPYSCHICGKTFVSHTPLKRHLTVHSEERKFKCNICDIAVKSSDSLKKHVLVMHTSERKNICDLCGAAFALQYNLKAHMKARHSERSGICDVCKKSFSNLAKHMNTHLGQRPFGCQMCSKRFFRQKGLTSHMAKHQNETATFPCTFENCESTFSKQCKLDFHILKYHTNHTPHVCQYCSKGFYRLPDLRRHLKSTHAPKDEISLPVTNEFPC